MTPEDMKEALALARDQSLALIEAATDIFAPNGVSWNQDEVKGDAEIIAFVLDLQQRPSPEFSIWQFLGDVNPKLKAELERDFQRATMKAVK